MTANRLQCTHFGLLKDGFCNGHSHDFEFPVLFTSPVPVSEANVSASWRLLFALLLYWCL
jgi:hypothetical protein